MNVIHGKYRKIYGCYLAEITENNGHYLAEKTGEITVKIRSLPCGNDHYINIGAYRTHTSRSDGR